jgi:hypothetical protein
MNDSNWSWHFNRNASGQDSRRSHYLEHLNNAKYYCSQKQFFQDDPDKAAKELGTAVHPLQDISAHGDYNNANQVSTSRIGVDVLAWYWHNWVAPYSGSQDDPDKEDLDAVTQSGFPTRAGSLPLKYNWGNTIISHYYRGGQKRINQTQNDTDKALKELQDYVKQNGGTAKEGKCKCRNAFDAW